MSINKIICHTFIVAFLGVSSLSGIAAEKNIRIKVSDEVYLSYSGTAEKKTPLGNGMISVIKDEHVIDKISGVFNGQSITNATVNFIEGTVFKGDVRFEFSDAGIVYTFSNGCFEHDGKEIFLSEPYVVNRTWKELKMNSEGKVLSNSSLSSPGIKCTSSEIVDNLPVDTFDEFVGAKPTILKEKPSVFYPGRGFFQAGKTIGEVYVLDYGEKGRGTFTSVAVLMGMQISHYEKVEKVLTIHCTNGDSLSHFFMGENLSKHDCSSAKFKTTVLRNIDGGKLEVHFLTHENFDIEDNFYNRNNYTNTSGYVKTMPLVQKFYQDMPEQYRQWIGCPRFSVFDIKDREGGVVENNGEKNSREESKNAVEVTYSNGDSYFGTIYMPIGKNKKDDVMYIGNLPNNDVDFFSGLYTTSQGEKKYFLYGYPADEFVQIANRKSEEIRAEKERAEMEYQQEQEAREKEAKAYRAELSRKYGKKYVDAIYDQYSILVGTPEGLLKEYYFLTVRRETKEHIVYSVARAYRANFMVWVNKSTHKVDEVRDL